jgi:hypothetical protein
MTTTKRPNGSVKALAEALGISPRRVSSLLSEGMPTTIPEAKVWRGLPSDNSQPVSDDSPAELRRRRIALLKKQEEKIALELDVRRGDLIEKGQVYADSLRCYSYAKAQLMTLPNSLPGQLAGLGEAAMCVILRNAIIAILSELSEASKPYAPTADENR